MPVVTGLYTVLLPLVAFAVFGSSRHLVVAADSATAAIFSSGLSGMAAPASAQYIALVGMVALLTAGFLLLARIFKLGFLADFLSRTVLVGFSLRRRDSSRPSRCSATWSAWRCRRTARPRKPGEILQALPQLSLPTLGLSALVAGGILIGRRVAPHVPMSLVAVVGTIAASAWFGFAARGIATLGPVPGGLPSIGLPRVSWTELLALLPVAASCFVVIVAQSAATSRGFALRWHERVDTDADILGLAAANAAAAVSGTFVGQRQPDPDRDGGAGRGAQPDRAIDVRRRRYAGAAWSPPARCNICRAACWPPLCSRSRSG
ncbi:MAG: SulP family inorganic anion transporter [Pseudomonadota bacterium]